MTCATERMLDDEWTHSGRRDVYSDFNALTLRVTTTALFGDDLPAQQGAQVTGTRDTETQLELQRHPFPMDSSVSDDLLRKKHSVVDFIHPACGIFSITKMLWQQFPHPEVWISAFHMQSWQLVMMFCKHLPAPSPILAENCHFWVLGT